jgi:phosphonate transport system permease protein
MLSSADKHVVFKEYLKAEKKYINSKKIQNIIFIISFFSLLFFSIYIGEVRLDNFIGGLPSFFNYINSTIPQIRLNTFFKDIAYWYWGINKWLLLMFDTFFIAFLATLIGSIIAFIACFPASNNLIKNKIIFNLVRRLLELFRSVPELVYALIFVFAFGLGPFPGVLAISIHSAGSLGKLFSEVNENIDLKPIEGLYASGANWLQTIRYAVIPQVLPNYLSYTLLRFEINIRAASIVGFVGAGGIGQELMFVIRQFVYTDISAIVILIMVSVVLIDLVCEKIRHRFIGYEGA